jgi:hypothetical protein
MIPRNLQLNGLKKHLVTSSVTRSSADNSEYSNNDDYDTGASRDRFRTAPGGEVPDGFGQDGFGQY